MTITGGPAASESGSSRAQIHGLRGDTSIAERARFDNFYIEHWSLTFDLVILIRTLSAIVHWLADGEGDSEAKTETRSEMPPLTAGAIPVSSGGTGPPVAV